MNTVHDDEIFSKSPRFNNRYSICLKYTDHISKIALNLKMTENKLTLIAIFFQSFL